MIFSDVFYFTRSGFKTGILKQDVAVAQPPLPQYTTAPVSSLCSGTHLPQPAGGTAMPLFLRPLFLCLYTTAWAISFTLSISQSLSLVHVSLFMPSGLPLTPQGSCAPAAFPDFTFLFMPLTRSSYLDSEPGFRFICVLFVSPLSWRTVFQALGAPQSRCLVNLAYPHIHS